MRPEVLQEAARLAADRRPFVMATVVWRRGPSSGQQGSTALILESGQVVGWLGGACAEPTVVRESRAALADGYPRLMFLGPEEEADGRLRDGIVSVPMACSSEGALEVFLEPMIPAQQLLVVGHSPAAQTLVRLAGDLEWDAVLIDDGANAGPVEGIEVRTKLDLADADEDTFVVIATQGHYDETAAEAALRTPAAYIGLVASAKRGDAVREYVRDRGLEEEVVARLVAPAGLDLGPVQHREMAVSILADLVQRKAAGVGERAVVAPEISEAIDPICGMTVDIAKARWVTETDDGPVYFCAPGCKKAFEGASG